MSKEYVESRIREALKATNGHALKAQQKIIAEAAQDHRLLLSLTRGHLTGIVALWINRVISRMDTPEEAPPERPQTLDMPPNTFGKEILQALQSDKAATFGQEGFAPPMKRKQASQSHIDALRMMARKGGKKPDES